MLDQLPPELVAILALAMTAVGAYLTGRRGEARRKAIDIETDLRAFLDERGLFPSPETREVDRDHIDAALAGAIPAYPDTDDVETMYSDGSYYAPVAADVSVLRTLAGGVSWLPYRPERFDCEEFAEAFSVLSAFVAGTNTVGIVHDWSAGHSYNIIVTAEGDVRFYEPQTDRFVALGGDLDGDPASEYQLTNALIQF